MALRNGLAGKNRLLLTGGGADGLQTRLPAASFTSVALTFMSNVALPYLMQRTVFESINQQLEMVFRHRLAYALKIHVALADSAALTTAAGSNLTVDAHADALDDTVSKMYVPPMQAVVDSLVILTPNDPPHLCVTW